jgi:hypothetical protein
VIVRLDPTNGTTTPRRRALLSPDTRGPCTASTTGKEIGGSLSSPSPHQTKKEECKTSNDRKSTKILFLSRHSLEQKQIDELRTCFGEIEIVQVKDLVMSGNHVIQMARELNADEIVAVLPLNIIAEILQQRRYKPIVAVSERARINARTGKPVFSHDHFDRIESVTVVSHPLRQEVKYGDKADE